MHSSFSLFRSHLDLAHQYFESLLNIGDFVIDATCGNGHDTLALARDNERKVVCVGNSSSGVKETPVFGCPTVNIGSRQLGRLRGQNVIDVEYNARSIFDLVMKCIKDKDFRLDCQKTDNPYYLGNAGVKIAEVLASIPINEQLLRKKMKLKGEVKDGWFR